jgi:toxoflavin biosynthesis protein ToxC
MIQHNGPISGVACSTSYVATAGYDNQVILWDARTKTALARGCHDHLANRCEFSSDEKMLVTASSDYTARIWRIPDMKLIAVLNDHTDDVEMARFSPDNSLVATASQDGAVRVFNLNGILQKKFFGHEGCVQSLAWSVDGQRIVSSGDDGTIRTWNFQTGAEESVFSPENVQTDAVAMSSNGVVFAGNDAGEVLRIENGEVSKVTVHTSGIKNLILNKQETALVSVSYDRSLTLIGVRTGLEPIRKVAIPAIAWARACAFQGENRLVFGTFGSSYAVVDLDREHWELEGIKSTDGVNAVLVNSEYIFAVGDAGEVRLAVRAGARDVVEARAKVAAMGSLCNFIVKFNDRVVCGGHLGKIFDASTGEELLELKCPINKAVQAGPYLVLATYVGELAICRERDGQLELVGEYKVLKNAVKDLTVCDQKIFCCGAAADIALFDLETMRVVASRSQAHGNIVNSCVAIGAGRFATVSRDLKMNIWNGVEEEASLKTPFNHSIKCASASADHRYIAAAAYDGTIGIYDQDLGTWPVFQRLTAAGVSSLTYDSGAFWASSYDGKIYQLRTP